MFKKTLLASSLTVALSLGAQGVQANPVNNLLEGLFNNITQQQLDARRGGGARRSSTVRRSSTSSSTSTYKSSTPTTSTTNNTSTASNTAATNNTAAKTNTTGTNNTTTNNTTNNTTNQTQDAQFSQRSGYNQQGYNQQGYNQQYGSVPQQRGSLGMGSTFISSLAGAGAGVLLANMLLSPAQAAEAGTDVATPDMLSDEQIKECLTQLDKDLDDAEKRLTEAAEEQKAQISEEISKMHELQTVLLKEQLNRLQNQ